MTRTKVVDYAVVFSLKYQAVDNAVEKWLMTRPNFVHSDCRGRCLVEDVVENPCLVDNAVDGWLITRSKIFWIFQTWPWN